MRRVYQGLGQQQAVEGIFKLVGQAVDVHRVLAGDGKLAVAIVEQTAAQQAGFDAEVVPPEGGLDSNLPQAGSAEEKLVARIVEKGERRCG